MQLRGEENQIRTKPKGKNAQYEGKWEFNPQWYFLAFTNVHIYLFI